MEICSDSRRPLNEMWQTGKHSVFPSMAASSHSIYCLIHPLLFPAPHTAVDRDPPHPPPLCSSQLIPKQGGSLDAYKEILKEGKGIEKERNEWEREREREGEREGERERGEGSGWRWPLLRSLISCGRQGSRGCTGSFPSAGAWLNSTRFL